jgi:putative transposase
LTAAPTFRYVVLMPRSARHVEAGTIYHVLNRGNGRRALFSKPADFQAFVELMKDAVARFEVDLLAFCLMGNHWHLLLRPRTDDALPRCMAWLTVTHARRHHAHYPNPGSGHLYQGRYKSFPVQSDEHFLVVTRYIHQNPLRANLAARVQDWRWTDLSGMSPVSEWPVDRPRRWTTVVNEAMSEADRRRVERSLRRGTPFGSDAWAERTAKRLKLSSTLRDMGRPRKPVESLSERQRRRRRKAEWIEKGHKST